MKKVWIEPIPSLEEVLQTATAEERERTQSCSPARRCETLAWRAIVRRELGAGTRIAYNAVGAPVLPDLPLHLSVSHCRGRVAVALSDRPCAVDVEEVNRRFEAVAPRYLAAMERSLSDHALFPAIAWSVKEALYKYAGVEGLDLLGDLRIGSLVWEENPDTASEADIHTIPDAGPDSAPSSALAGRAGCRISGVADPVEVRFRVEGSCLCAWIL